ncbi:NAD-dependent epimerase/dehydratase family protein [Blastococcus sp. TF02A-26]|uniref:NAD-dependent epimerase/dehydratase family protein n=1 Tax=Blastococcus sp. TF02A-26 TaxID=2250577 RepID=UPI000DEA9E58|nr:NAD-dependent epimerase/dehydratase family protein [Blastococcus sp. TF02A-26]RBY89825.1 pyridine nucleotide transhydrogenase [Blastococcus sp. TF02A-26]
MSAARRRALIGWTGFVGGELDRRIAPVARFRSTDIDQLPAADVDEVVCAGAPAEKWKANAEPEADRANIQRLIDALDRSSARSCVLVSTVDVYSDSRQADEDTAADTAQEQAYGRHRALLERFVTERFEDSLVVRLPGMFGPGLKKNLVYDLIHQPGARFAHEDSTFQFYDVRDLWGHVLLARDAGLRVVNLATEPVSSAQVARECFGVEYSCTDRPQVAYDLRTAHAARLAGRDGAYLRSAGEVLAGIRAWGAALVGAPA